MQPNGRTHSAILSKDCDDAISVSSYDFIPSPHNKIASLHGPPAWHEDYEAQTLRQTPQQTPDETLDASNDCLNPGVTTYEDNGRRSPDVKSPEHMATLSNRYPKRMQEQKHPEGLPSDRKSSKLSLPRRRSRKVLVKMKDFIEMKERARYGENKPVNTTPLNPGAQTFTPSPPVKQGPPPPPPTRTNHPEEIHDIVKKLLHPPQGYQDAPGLVAIGLPWVVQTVGSSHMEYKRRINRMVLRKDSEVRIHGVELGIPPEYMTWLCGEGGHMGNILCIPVARLLGVI